MKKSESLHKTLAFAAAVAALGTSVGATMEHALAQSEQGKIGAVQDKTTPLRKGGAAQLKYESNQHKVYRRGVHPISPAASGITISGKSRIGATQDKDRAGAGQGKVINGPGGRELVPAVKQP
ncbi:MAG: hypothetical protein WAU52_14135 [Burkholderiales bacterium]